MHTGLSAGILGLPSLIFLFCLFLLYIILHRRQYEVPRKLEDYIYKFDELNRKNSVVYRWISKTVVGLGQIAIFLGWLLILYGYFLFLYKMIFGFFGL